MKWFLRLLAVLVVAVAVLLGLAAVAGRGVFGLVEGGGTPNATAREPRETAAIRRQQVEALDGLGADPARQVLFGDLHVHTTFSADAFTFSLPMMGGEGGHPPSDACDFARHCANLDFWSINDHAGNLTPRRWQETVDAIRQCNEVGGDSPDSVAFLGWEWTQAGRTPETHFGHKNVVLRHTDDDRIPTRPIGAIKPPGDRVGELGLLPRGLAALAMGGRFHDWAGYQTETEEVAECEAGPGVRDLPTDCRELVATPAELFEKLDDWGHESIVIPHGTAWGIYTPPASTWDKQLEGPMHDEERQTLLEIYSGHGDSEVYRDWRAVVFDDEGNPVCPPPSENYLPACWRAGELIEERCRAEGAADKDCAARAALARERYLAGGSAGHLVVPGAVTGDWLDAGQCQDCRQPAYNYRPGSSAQYILALGNFDEDPSSPRRFRMGFMGSSDNHYARAGSGYKEVARRGMTESVATGPAAEQMGAIASVITPPEREKIAHSLTVEEALDGVAGFQRFETERSTAFLITGGLIAAHTDGRDRDAIWESMQRREVYSTTGPRILLFFDLLNSPRGSSPMGSEVEMSGAPRFRVRAAGSFEQKPGCPSGPIAALGDKEIARLCKGECYHPGDTRRPITRLEVVRIRPQIHAGEDIASLVEDPWKSFACDGNPAGCVAEFEDPDYVAGGRGVVYYARAFEAPAPAINGQNLRCERDSEGRCLSIRTCPGEDGAENQCLGTHEPRAVSSPIWVDPPPA